MDYSNTRDSLLALLLLAMPVAAAPSMPQLSGGKQNVVVLLADDVGVDMVGAYEPFYASHPHPNHPNTTPAIDYLAQTGLLFRNAWTNPVCSSTRAQIMTGKHSRRHGVGWIIGPHPASQGLQNFHDTIPSMLRGGGFGFSRYHTAALGKWHLAGNAQHPPPFGRIHPNGNPKPWFHEYAGSFSNFSGNEDYNLWLKTFGSSISAATDECLPPRKGFCSATVSDYATVDTADDAIHLIQVMPEPFFLYVAFNAAHLPLNQPNTPPSAASCPGVGGQPSCDFNVGSANRTRCVVQWMDNEIGRILCAIESDPGKPTGPTTIVFMGDNGTAPQGTVAPFLPSHSKLTLYDGGVNVPLIVKSSLIRPSVAGTSTQALVTSTDLFATVADITRTSEPPDPFGLRDSTSFLPVLRGGVSTVRTISYAELFFKTFIPSPQGNPPPNLGLPKHMRTVRNVAGFKLHQTVEQDGSGGLTISEELYDLPNDPFELTDRLSEAMNGIEPYASNYALLRAQLDFNYPHLVTP